MKTSLLCLLLLCPLFVFAASPKSAKPLATSASLIPAATPTVVDSGSMPFSNSEADFYRRAWPVDTSHSKWALVLFGGVLLTIFAFLIRAMAKSKPRQLPPQKK